MVDRLHSFTLADVLRENARTHPDGVALVCGDERVTFPELDAEVSRFAGTLRELGVGAGDRVAWIGYNCHRLVELFYACAKLGAVAAPLNWRLTSQEYDGILRSVQPSVVLTSGDAAFDDLNAATRRALPNAPLVLHDDPAFHARIAEAPDTDPANDAHDELPVLQIMTAAFGGTPLAAQLTSRGIVAQDLVLRAVGLVRPVEEVYLGAGPMFHIGVLLKLFATVHWGGTNVIVPQADAEEICRLIEVERCTSAYVFPPTMRQMVEVSRGGRYDLGSLVDTFGGIAPEDLAEEWYALTSCKPPAQSGLVGYGTSETVGMVTFEGRPPDSTSPFGRPSPIVALRIFDPAGDEVPAGEIGEIAVRGPQVMAGYLGEPPLDPDGWRNTGDLGRREPDGSVTFLGPNQEIIKSGMENIYPVEVETALRRHDAVRDACVVGRPDPEWGSSVLAVVELEPGADAPSEADLINFTKTHIASYKKPRQVVFVDALPRNAFGAPDRVAVRTEHVPLG